jgi:hypothetical protein
MVGQRESQPADQGDKKVPEKELEHISN